MSINCRESRPLICYSNHCNEYKGMGSTPYRQGTSCNIVIYGWVVGCAFNLGRGPAEVCRLPVALSKLLVDIVLLSQGERSRPLKKPGCPRLETEQGKGFALSSGRITTAGGSGLSRGWKCRTTIFLSTNYPTFS